jgi:hypothetical protein
MARSKYFDDMVQSKNVDDDFKVNILVWGGVHSSTYIKHDLLMCPSFMCTLPRICYFSFCVYDELRLSLGSACECDFSVPDLAVSSLK